MAAFLDPSRRPAPGPARRRAGAAWSGKLHHRASLRRRRAGRCARDGALCRPGQHRVAAAARRCGGRLRRHPFGGAGAVLSGRRPVRLSRHQYVARRDPAAALSHRAEHRPHRSAAFDPHHLSDPRQRRRCRQPAGQLGGGDRARRGGAGRLEQARAARGLLPDLSGLGLRLARRADHDPQRGCDLFLPDGRSRPGRALELRAGDAARRRRASDVPAGRQRRRAGDHRRRHPGASARQ